MVIVYLAIACGVGALVRYFFSRYNQLQIAPRNSHSQSSRMFFDRPTLQSSGVQEVHAILATGFLWRINDIFNLE